MCCFDNFDFNNFWDDSEYARDEYISEYPTDEMISKLENELGYKLPESYIWLMKKHNGGIPINDCFPTDIPTNWAEDHVAITGIYGIGYKKSSSLGGEFGSEFWIEEWGYPEIGVAICDCPSAGHDMIFLDYRECGPKGEPCVVHIDQEYDYKITWLAKDFESFIRGLVNGEVYDDSEQIKEEYLEMAKNAKFSPNLLEISADIDEIPELERKIRTLSTEIIEEKGHFSLHADEKSMLLYDLQFWLYSRQFKRVSKEKYFEDYSQIMACAGKRGEYIFSCGGYAPAFIEDWLEQRIQEKVIVNKNGEICFTSEAARSVIKKMNTI
ncbi:SMI1/KNR4 family protein [Bacillus pseudomycoides]|uniref:SMI1/KNR4 family protein n=1 Tax=Bacillus pseudomycoides TaxID=64104 RepID=UPI001F0B5C31|nr:SMI1/KNR4 family protein [Bacillus pseudomycoides]